MLLKLTNFRSHGQLDLQIDNGQLILLSGSSGSGKTTILEAISWCFYGWPRNVQPHDQANTKTSVWLRIGALTIQRSRPGGLELEYHDRSSNQAWSLTQDEAQAYLHQFLGQRNAWLASAYLIQGQPCHLLTLSNKEKTELLDQITFQGDDPQLYLSRVEQELHRVSEELKGQHYRLQGLLTGAQAILHLNLTVDQLSSSQVEGWRDQLNQYGRLILDPTNWSQLQTKIKVCQQTILARQKQINLRQQQAGRLSLLEEQQVSLVKWLEESATGLEVKTWLRNLERDLATKRESLAQLKQQLQQQQALQQKHQQWLDLSQRLKQAEEDWLQLQANLQPSEIEKWRGQLNLALLKEQVKQHQQYRQLLASSDGELLTFDTKTSLVELHNLLAEVSQTSQFLKQDLAQITTIKAWLGQLAKLDLDGPEALNLALAEVNNRLTKTVEDLTSLTQQVYATTILTCPHCQQHVKWEQGHLHPSDLSPSANQQLRREQDQRKQQLLTDQQQLKRKQQQLQQLKQQQPDLTKLGLVPEQAKLEKQLQRLNLNLTYLQQLIKAYQPAPELDLETANQYWAYYQQEAEVKHLQTKLTTSDSVEMPSSEPKQLEKQLEEVSQACQTLQLKLAQAQDKHRQLVRLESEISQLRKSQAQSGPDLPQLEEQLSQLQQTAQQHQQAEQAHGLFQQLVSLADYYLSLAVRQANLIELKQIMVEAEHQRLTEALATVNHLLEEVLILIFDEPISVRLQTFKQLKTTGLQRSNINLSIHYKGIEYDKLSLLSGGELARVSLALTLALSHLNGSPLLLLDECFSALNSPLRVKCLEAIRRFHQAKTVICISHEDVEGDYDQVIHL